MKIDSRTGLVILAPGGPDKIEDVEPLLRKLHSDRARRHLPWYRRPFQAALAESALRRNLPLMQSRYEAMCGESPLVRVTGGQVNAIAERLGCEGYVAMRYWRPSADEAVALMRAEGVVRAVVLDGSPAWSAATTQSRVDDFTRAWRAVGGAPADLHVVDRWASHPAFVAVVAAALAETTALLRGSEGHLLFAAPGVPRWLCEAGDPYEREIRAALERVLAVASPTLPHSLCWIPPDDGQPGLDPVPTAEITRLAEAGIKNVVVVPFGIVADGLETAYHLDLEVGRATRERKMRLYRVPTLNDRSELIGALVGIVRESVAGRTAELEEGEVA